MTSDHKFSCQYYEQFTLPFLEKSIKESHSWQEVAQKCGLRTVTPPLTERVKELNIDTSHLNSKHFDGLRTKFNNFSKDALAHIVASHTKWMDIMKSLGYTSYYALSMFKKKLDTLGISYDHVENSFEQYMKQFRDLKDILVENSKYSGMTALKKRLIKEMGWEYKCSVCQLSEWQGRPIPIEIDHINGNHYDHRIENIRFICPNCHAFTDTYKGKNMQICKNKNKLNTKEPQLVPDMKPSTGCVDDTSLPKEPRKKKLSKCCIDCNENIDRKSTRCLQCHYKHVTATDNETNGKKPPKTCADCDKQVHYKNIRCMDCHNKYRFDGNSPKEPKPLKEPKPPREKKPPKTCADCDKEIHSHNTRCMECNNKYKFTTGSQNRPSYEQLLTDLETLPYVQVGLKYNVSDNCIRKWIKRYEQYGITS